MTLPVPPHLARLSRQFLAEEVRAEVRHAIRNKLASIRNAAFYLRRQVETGTDLFQRVARVPRFFGLIETEIESASALLTGEFPPEGGGSEAASVDEVCRGLLARLSLPAGVELSRRGREALKARVVPDELQLALFFLLENAVDSPGASKLVLEQGVDDHGVWLAVEDDGEGFSSEALVRGCEAFFTTRAGCEGLGLAVVRRIVERRWGGKVELGNGSARGARVKLVLPEASRRQAGRVLFVDDNESNRLTLGTLLEEEGYEVVEAGSVAEGRACLGQPFALAILDVHLPDGEGTSLIPDLGAQRPRPVVAVLSGSMEVESMPGADLVLTKADDPARLLAALRQALGHRSDPPCA